MILRGRGGLRNVGLRMRRTMRGLRLSLRYVSLLSSIRSSLFLHFDLRSHCRARQPSCPAFLFRHQHAEASTYLVPQIRKPGDSQSLSVPPSTLSRFMGGGRCLRSGHVSVTGRRGLPAPLPCLGFRGPRGHGIGLWLDPAAGLPSTSQWNTPVEERCCF